MKLNMKSDVWFKLKNLQPYPLTATMEGTGTGAAQLINPNLIRVTLATAEVNKYVEISTPIGFTVKDVRIRHDNNTQCAIQVLNAAQEIVAAIAIAASDKDIDRALDVDNTSPAFIAGDDDLRLEISTGAFTGVVDIIIEPTVA